MLHHVRCSRPQARRSSSYVAFACITALVACEREATAPPSNAPVTTAFVPAANVSEAAPILSWLAPLGQGVPAALDFDAAAAPSVEICSWDGGGCSGPAVARFSTVASTGTAVLAVNPIDGVYEGAWSLTDARFATRKTYRIRALLGAMELGAISVDVVRGRWALTRSDGKPAPLAAAASVPIRFTLARAATYLPPSSQPLVAQAHALLVSADPVATYQALLDRLGSIYAAYPPAEADRQIQVIAAQAFDRQHDGDALARLAVALGGHAFTIASPHESVTAPATALASRVAPLVSRAAVAVPAPQRPQATVIYVNGILTDPLEAGDGLLKLESLLRTKNGWRFADPASPYRGVLLYNPSYAYVSTSTRWCVAVAQLGQLPLDAEQLPSALARLQSAACSLVFDLGQAAAQILSLTGVIPSEAQPAARTLADRIKAERADGHVVLLAAHSQGNLMAQQAQQLLTGDEAKCVGISSFASPSSDFSAGPEFGIVDGYVVQGAIARDIVGANPANSFSPRYDTEMSRVYDQTLRLPLPPIVAGIAAGVLDLRLHYFENYLADPTLGTIIADRFGRQDAKLVADCARHVAVAPSQLTMTRGSTNTLTAQLRDAQERPLAVQAVEWSSSNPGVARVDGSSQAAAIVGLAAGTATITAKVGGATAGTAIVTVEDRPTSQLAVASCIETGPDGKLVGGSFVADPSGFPTGSEVRGMVTRLERGATPRPVLCDVQGLTQEYYTYLRGIYPKLPVIDGGRLVITSIAITPLQPRVAAGDSVQLTATGMSGTVPVRKLDHAAWKSRIGPISSMGMFHIAESQIDPAGTSPYWDCVEADYTGDDVAAPLTSDYRPVQSVHGIGNCTQIQRSVARVVIRDNSGVVSRERIGVGTPLQLSAVALDNAGNFFYRAQFGTNVLTTPTVTWSSSDNGVATVDATGRTVGVARGTTTITAESEGTKAMVTLTVGLDVTGTWFYVVGDTQRGDVVFARGPLSLTWSDPETGEFTGTLVRTFQWEPLISPTSVGTFAVRGRLASDGSVTFTLSCSSASDRHDSCGPPVALEHRGAFDGTEVRGVATPGGQYDFRLYGRRPR